MIFPTRDLSCWRQEAGSRPRIGRVGSTTGRLIGLCKHGEHLPIIDRVGRLWLEARVAGHDGLPLHGGGAVLGGGLDAER
jgi:hypothetical protein